MIARFQLTEEQTKAILDMRLRRLTGLEKGKLEAEYRELTEQIAYYRSLLADEDKLLGVIKEELEEIKRVHGDKRRTKIKPAAHEIDIEELIEKEDVLITLTKDGYIKRTPTSAYKLQHRGGKGILGISSRTDDFVETLFVASTHDDLVLFTNKGKVYKMKAYEIPEGKRTARGQNIVNLLSLMPGKKSVPHSGLKKSSTKTLSLSSPPERAYSRRANWNCIRRSGKRTHRHPSG